MATRDWIIAHDIAPGVHLLQEARQVNAYLVEGTEYRCAHGPGVTRFESTYKGIQARARGFERVSLETGSQDAFVPARALYVAAGFEPCGPFGSYEDVPTSAFFTRAV